MRFLIGLLRINESFPGNVTGKHYWCSCIASLHSDYTVLHCECFWLQI